MILVLWNSVYPESLHTDTPAAASTNCSPRSILASSATDGVEAEYSQSADEQISQSLSR